MKKRLKDSPLDPQYTLFLGCTVPVRAVNYELSARKVAERLGIDLFDVPGFFCCGYPIKSVDHYAYLLMAARNLALAEEKGLPLCTLCSACCGALTEANHEIQEDRDLRKRINEDLFQWLGKRYEGEVRVTHFVRVLQKEIGKERISSEVTVDLSSLQLAPHYGCHYTKPTTLYGKLEDPENPKSLDELIEATGAKSISYENRLQCCGGGVLAIDEQVALAMAHSKLEHIRSRQADAMILLCPFCDIMYEANQMRSQEAVEPLPAAARHDAQRKQHRAEADGAMRRRSADRAAGVGTRRRGDDAAIAGAAVVHGNRAAESRRSFFRDREDQRAVLNDRIRRIEVHEVAVERPVALRPAGGIEAIEVVRPVEHELPVLVPVVLDPVDELVRGQRRFVQRAGPARLLLAQALKRRLAALIRLLAWPPSVFLTITPSNDHET